MFGIPKTTGFNGVKWSNHLESRKPTDFWSYPVVVTNIAMENHHEINGTTHYFYGHFQ